MKIKWKISIFFYRSFQQKMDTLVLSKSNMKLYRVLGVGDHFSCRNSDKSAVFRIKVFRPIMRFFFYPMPLNSQFCSIFVFPICVILNRVPVKRIIIIQNHPLSEQGMVNISSPVPGEKFHYWQRRERANIIGTFKGVCRGGVKQNGIFSLPYAWNKSS